LRVLKFGGSSVATPDRIRQVTSIVAAQRAISPLAVVVSAFGGVTDRLQEAASLAEAGDLEFQNLLAELRKRHEEAVSELAAEDEAAEELTRLEASLAELGNLLAGCYLLREVSPRTLDGILSFGERLSAPIIAAAFRAAGLNATAWDARQLILTESSFGAAQVDHEVTTGRLREALQPSLSTSTTAGIPVITGFVAANVEGRTTTLGRGGSDYTASIVGAAFEAEAVELWTDVDGVMNADPRLVRSARPIAAMSYIELMELSHFGAKVVHPPSVHPTRQKGIPLLIKNTFNPEAPGTRVHGSLRRHPSRGGTPESGPISGPVTGPVRGIASIPRVALLRLEGDGMVGVPGIAMRLFGALARRDVNIILISQASSEHSICFGIAPESLAGARKAVADEFTLEQRAGLIEELVVEEDLAVVAVVGTEMRRRPGLAGRVFSVLGEHGISVRAIAQGSSELNISLVVSSGDERLAVRALHEACFSEEGRTAEIYLTGVGRVGRALLGQLAAHRDEIEKRRGVRLLLAGIASSKASLVDLEGIDPKTALDQLRSQPTGGGVDELLTSLEESRRLDRLFVDCTASGPVAAAYDRALASGAAVVTANKLRLAGPLASYRPLANPSPGSLYFETTAGAGLPVIRTLEDLLATGDNLLRVEGLLSGTMTYLMDQIHQGLTLSAAVRKAYDLGYTEPDPREDLGGMDVARKLLILARVAGRALELEQVTAEPLLPPETWAALTLEEFWERLPDVDEAFLLRRQEAEAQNRRLAFLAVLDSEGARVSLQALPEEHPCAAVRGSDNLIALTTERYSETPLVLRGPGAGPEVTAAGVFSDLLRAVAEAPGRGVLAPTYSGGDPS